MILCLVYFGFAYCFGIVFLVKVCVTSLLWIIFAECPALLQIRHISCFTGHLFKWPCTKLYPHFQQSGNGPIFNNGRMPVLYFMFFLAYVLYYCCTIAYFKVPMGSLTSDSRSICIWRFRMSWLKMLFLRLSSNSSQMHSASFCFFSPVDFIQWLFNFLFTIEELLSVKGFFSYFYLRVENT